MNEKNEIKYSICNMRLTGIDKAYYKNQLEEFCKSMDYSKIMSVHFGKQDIRGGFSITILDLRHCVPEQKFFTNKWEMLGFVTGFNEARKKGNYGAFKRWLK